MSFRRKTSIRTVLELVKLVSQHFSGEQDGNGPKDLRRQGHSSPLFTILCLHESKISSTHPSFYHKLTCWLRRSLKYIKEREMKVCEQSRRKGNFHAAAGQVYPLTLPQPDPPTGKMSGKKKRERLRMRTCLSRNLPPNDIPSIRPTLLSYPTL